MRYPPREESRLWNTMLGLTALSIFTYAIQNEIHAARLLQAVLPALVLNALVLSSVQVGGSAPKGLAHPETETLIFLASFFYSREVSKPLISGVSSEFSIHRFLLIHKCRILFNVPLRLPGCMNKLRVRI